MVGSEETVMRWAVFTTFCSVFRSATEQLPYHIEMQLVRMLSMVQLSDGSSPESEETDGPLTMLYLSMHIILKKSSGPYVFRPSHGVT